MFVLPEQLPSTAAELNVLQAAAQAQIRVFQARNAAGQKLTADDATELRTLLDARKTVKAALDNVAAEAAAINDLLAEAAKDEGGPEVQATDASETDESEAADIAEPTPVVAEVTEQAPAMAAAGAGAPPAASPAPVSFAGAGGGSGPALITRGEPGWLMHPGAPGYRPDLGKVGFGGIAAALNTMKPGSRSSFQPNRPNKMVGGFSYARQVVASLARDAKVVDDSHALVAAIQEATSMLNGKRVTAEALVAAGGWCAPSEQLYDFCDVPDASDLVSLPEITINRGGIRWPREPDLSGIFEDFEWFFTETELEAVDGGGNPTAIKQCVEIPCADTFDEIRLNAVGWCVEAGILQEQGWPELSEWFMRQLTQEHLRALSRRTVLNVVSGSGSAIVIPPTSVLGSAASVLNSLALMATNIRLKRGLSRTATIEGIAPSWFHEVLRADIAMRDGGIEVFSVSDAQINAALVARNIALQFVGDWQTRSTGLPGALATTTWPGTVDVVLYPAGTWFRSMASVIELGVMYPKEQLQVNRFTRMFTEDSLAVGKRCGESVLARIPLNTSGEVGARRQITIDPGNKTVALTTTGVPTGGTFTLILGGRETGTIAFGASAATVKTALVALDDAFTAADFTTSGGALPTAVSITYPSELGSLVKGTNSLTGGTSPNVVVA